MDRIEAICSLIEPCETFADIGCDHGYCTLYAFKRNLCSSAVVTDISAKSLQKAENLLSSYITIGACLPVCCDGLSAKECDCEQVLIAGMGGEEILKILKRDFIPRKFILQPMKNAPQLREFLIGSGCKILRDDVFFSHGKYYFIIKGERSGGTELYDEKQLLFGRDSLNNPVIKRFAEEEKNKRQSYLKNAQTDEAKAKLLNEIRILEEVIEYDG